MIRRKKTNSKKEYKQLNLVAWITCIKMKCVVFWLLNPELLWWVSVCYLRVPLTARIIWCRLWGTSELVWNIGCVIQRSAIKVRRNRSVSSATLSTTHPTWTCFALNCGLHGESPTTNCLSHNSALGECGQDFLKAQRNCPWELRSPVITKLLNFVFCSAFVV
jgi:hypothetical protein